MSDYYTNQLLERYQTGRILASEKNTLYAMLKPCIEKDTASELERDIFSKLVIYLLGSFDRTNHQNVLKYAFFCFAIAFTVSMFDAGRTHTILIVTGSIVALVATYPRGKRVKETLFCSSCFTKTWWWALWITTVVSMVVWINGYIQTSNK